MTNNNLAGAGLRTILLVVAGLLAAASVAIAVSDGLRNSEDLQNILVSATAFWRGENPYLDFLAREKSGTPFPGYDPNYFPPMYVLVGTILWLDWPIVRIGMVIANVIMGAGLMVMLQRLYLPGMQRWQTFLLVCALFTSTPFRSLVYHGQTTFIGLCGIIGALYLLQHGRRLASVPALFLALMKYSVSLPLALVFAQAGRWKLIIVAALVHLGLVAFGAFWLGTDLLSIIQQSLATNGHLVHQGFMNYSNILLALGDGGGEAGIYLSAIIILAVVALAIFRKHDDDLLRLGLFSVASVLCLYHTGYDMVLYAIPLVLVVRTFREKGWAAMSLLERITMGLLSLVIALIWWGLEAIEHHLMPWMATTSHGGAIYDEPHAIEVWYVLMLSVTVSLVGLYVLVWRASSPLRRRAIA